MLSRKPVQKLKDSGDSDVLFNSNCRTAILLVEIADIDKLKK